MTNISKSISELEGWEWIGDIPTKDNSSYVVRKFYELHKKPIRDYDLEEIYFMLSEDRCLDILVPLAMKALMTDVLVEAGDFPGDLLTRLLVRPISFWENHPSEREALLKVLSENKGRIRNVGFELCDEIGDYVKECVSKFETMWGKG